MKSDTDGSENPDSEIKYCIAGLLDLQGFSGHMEVSSDIRTPIGGQAIKRLQTLEEVRAFLIEEQQNTSFPFQHKRINDSIIFTIDLNDVLKPRVGDTYRVGMSTEEWKELYGNSEANDREENDENYSRNRKEYTLQVIKFIGLVSRIHQLVSIRERDDNFPGAKTILSTGFRRRFIELDGNEDNFSANFAFSNSYKAQDFLKGAGLFLDNHIIEMMDADVRIKNIAKLACLSYNRTVYSPLKLADQTDKIFVESRAEKVSLFRRTYYFRNVNANPLTYLQFVDDLEDRNDMHDFIVSNITEENIDEKIKNGEHFNILKIPYDMGKEMYESFERKLEERRPQVTIHCFGCQAAVEAEWKFCVECGIDLHS